MNHYAAVSAAMKAKAPIVAIPVENHAPVCIERARLAKWSKGVNLTKVAITGGDIYTTTEYERPKGYGSNLEGPINRIEVEHRTPRRLVLEGTAGRVKTRAVFVPIDRRIAVKTLAVWSEKERAKREKNILLGALANPKAKRALKLAQYETESEDRISARIVYESGKRAVVTGLPVPIPQLAELTFIVHRALDAKGEPLEDAWSVSETLTGHAAGKGKTAEEAILHARKNSINASPETLTRIRAMATAAAATVNSVAA